MRQLSYKYRSIRLLLPMIALVFCVVLTGCIRKRMTVRSNPPGAMAYIDKQPIGLTPVSTSFTYYGTRNFELVRDGYRPERFLRKIGLPWYAIPPLDFFSETLWPFEMRDERIIDVQLTPAPVVSTEALIEGGEQLRLQSSQGIASSVPPTRTTLVPIVIQPTAPNAFAQPISNVPILGPALNP